MPDPVVLLLHFDGTNGSTTFTDSSSYNRTLTPAGNVNISTAQSKFGGASGAFDGSGDYLSVGAPLVGTGDFTIEAFVRLANPSLGSDIYNQASGSVDPGRLEFSVYQGKLRWQIGGTSRSPSSPTLASNTWYHVAWSRAGDTHRLFVDGALIDTTSNSTTPSQTGNGKIGTDWAGTWCPNGYIDELRIANVAVYTEAFTAPSAPLGLIESAHSPLRAAPRIVRNAGAVNRIFYQGI